MNFEKVRLGNIPLALRYEYSIKEVIMSHGELEALSPEHCLLGLIEVKGDSCFAPEKEYYEKYEKPVLESAIPGERVLARQIRVIEGYQRDLDAAIAQEADRIHRTKELESSQKA